MSEYYEGIGRRKEASARVRITMREAGLTEAPSFVVNDKPVEEFFPRYGDLLILSGPLEAAGLAGRVDVTVKVQGGGITGQTSAVRLGLARALVKYDENLRSPLRAGDHLTRDARVKERKKPGLKRARKAPTYTKR